MSTYTELVAQAEPARRRLAALDRPRLAVCIDTSSIAVGAQETLAALRDEVSRRGLDVDVVQTGGDGLSFANPVVRLRRADGTDVVYQRVTAGQAPAFVETIFQKGDLDNEWLLGAFHENEPERLRRLEDLAWWSVQERRLMSEMGVIDPESIDEAIAAGAYAGLDRALAMAPEEVIAEITGAKLLGRSGSFFPTARKWDLLRTSRTEPKAMVCNADEGDTGAWVNRLSMENDPHAVIEGIMIGGWAAGARIGYVYIREEYPLAYARMVRAVEQARERGVIGLSVLGRGFEFEIKVIRGAGSYVCGEETGLIASIEDARGMPKIKPPYPAESGVLGQGSNVNNVGSYHTAAWIMRHGVEEYVKAGTERNPGTMMFTLSGHIQRVGCFELPFGTTVRQAYEVCGGGTEAGHSFKALQPGGPLLGIMPEFCLDLGIEPEAFREKGAIGVGGGGFVFLDDRACVLDLCSQYEWFIEDESCGRCTTCHGGTQRAVEIIRRIQRGQGRESDLPKLRLLASTVRYSNCFHGQFALAIIVNALDWFMDEVEEHIFQKRCRAGVCKRLIRYEVVPEMAIGQSGNRAIGQSGEPEEDQEAARPEALEGRRAAEGLPQAYDYCPTGAIKLVDGAYVIEDALCIRCDVCRQLAPDAIRVVDYYERDIGPAPELISVQPAER
jgi:NADH-quinone oxidoreductase subunit F